MHEVQLTQGLYGHTLNPIQVFSPDDKWIVYDTRNDETQIVRTCCIEKVNVRTAEVVRLYSAPRQSVHGPGVGAAAWHPSEDKVIFIHGLLNCDESKPYGAVRRFGAILDNSRTPARIASAEARTVAEPLVPGALRGGTHAHSWSADGQWISFTYNDYLMEQLQKTSPGKVKDLRTIGVMSSAARVSVFPEDAENFSGQYFATVTASVTESPRPGSDEIEKAFDECWIGTNGYLRGDGARQRRAVAFQGHIRDANDSLVTEIFISDIPDDITKASESQLLQGTFTSRPCVPEGLVQRRLTFTTTRKFPGIQSPRFWLRSAPDGSEVYFLMKDDAGLVQIFSVSVAGGEIRQITDLPRPVQAQFNVSPDGRSIAVIADNSVWVTDIRSGQLRRLTPRSADAEAPTVAVVWDNRGKTVAYNRYVRSGKGQFLQIFTLKVN